VAKDDRIQLKEKFIKYVGLSDVRVIRPADWATIGIEAEELRWDKRNNFKVRATHLPRSVLEYCQHDRELVIVDE
jgi:hypothetical protein